MKINYVLLTLIFLSLSSDALPEHIKIKPAKKDDIPALCKLNRSVEFEYFKPLYQKGYQHFSGTKNLDERLEKELKQNKQWFKQSIHNNNDTTIYVAQDKQKNRLTGMIAVYQNNKKTLEIVLLLVEENYRKLGIGRALINYAIKQFPHISTCIVYPLKYANQKTLQFYKSVGFKEHTIPKEYKKEDLYVFYKKKLRKNK